MIDPKELARQLTRAELDVAIRITIPFWLPTAGSRSVATDVYTCLHLCV